MRGEILIAALAALALGGTAQAQVPAEKRVALVIGNSAYKEAPLKNPVNDARAMSARLKELGFEVVARENANRAAMASAVGEFVRKLTPGGAALIYYAGHGVQVRGRNYLIPVDMPLETETDLRFQAVDVGTLTDELDQAQSRVSFIVLDACRNNPFERRLRGAARGLAAVDAARGSLIAYATAPGSVAADGEGDNGVYTAALLKALAQPGLKAEDVFKRVRIEVTDQTRNAQTPWESSSLTGDFVFNLTVTVGATVTVPAALPATADREALFWQSVKDSKSAADFEDYLRQFPNGMFASLAKRRIEDLKKPPQQAAVPPPRPAPAPAPAKPAVVAPPSGAPAPGTVFRDCPECPEMVTIPAGSFMMGSTDEETTRESMPESIAKREKPRHSVSVRSFALGKNEVTREQFAQFVRESGHSAGGGCYVYDGKEWKQEADRDWRSPGFAQSERDPVACVNWDDAKAYAAWLSKKTGKGYRLPSEAEWEYAARAGTSSARHWGEDASQACGYANVRDATSKFAGGAHACNDGQQFTAPVGSYKANGYGLHDMLGNVWEWTEDCWNESSAGAPSEGTAWTSGECSRRVLRGGSWYDGPWAVRSAFRGRNGVTILRTYSLGFRVARTD